MGCYCHGCPLCKIGDDEAKSKHEQTQERLLLLKLAGLNVETMWDCSWNKFKKSLPDRKELELKAELRTIRTRDAFFGGRTECIKKYHKCVGRQKYITEILRVNTLQLMP